MGHGQQAHKHKGDDVFGMGPGAGMVNSAALLARSGGALNRNPPNRLRPVPTEAGRQAMLDVLNTLARAGKYAEIVRVWKHWKQDGRVAPGKQLPARWKPQNKGW